MEGQTNKRIRQAKWPQQLRKAPTDAERTLWQRLKGRELAGCKFRRQHPYGDFILDFVCLEHGIVVELDGGQHADAVNQDSARTRFLEAAGFVVLRFWNHDVLGQLEVVLGVIFAEIEKRLARKPFP